MFKTYTFGCKVNTYDTGLLEARLQAAGYMRASQLGQPRLHILNTCAVTAEATQEAVRQVRRLKAKDPFCTVVVTGCAAQVDTDTFASLQGADLIVANSHKTQLEQILRQYFRGELKERVFKSNIFRKEDMEPGGGIEAGHTRAFLKIQDGCNSFCSFCVIPFARGKSRSLGVESLCQRIQELNTQGVNEVVLTGVHIGDYEDPLTGSGLADLVAAVLQQTSMPRIRLSSLEPIELTPQLLDLFSNPRLCPHFHMSIQSATSSVLERMRRQYGSVEVEDSLKEIHRRLPQAFVGMDVIAGFTGETEDEFAETFERLNSLPWTRLHVFPYSERQGTRAAKNLEQVPMAVRQSRARRLRELSTERFRDQALAQVGHSKQVLFLSGKKPGLSRDYWPVQLREEHDFQAGQECNIKIVGYDHSVISRMDGILIGQRV